MKAGGGKAGMRIFASSGGLLFHFFGDVLFQRGLFMDSVSGGKIFYEKTTSAFWNACGQ